jgi:IclR family transcriptional regulator, acetate operon repressor
MDEKAGASGRRRGRPSSVAAEPVAEVQSLDRAMAILGVLAAAEGLSLSEIARRSGLPTSTVHRLLATLERRELVAHDRLTGSWTVGVGLFHIGSAYLRVRKLPEIGRPIMRSLLDEVNETVNLTLLEGRDIVCVAQAESHAPVRAFFRLGSRLPVHASGAGKSMLAAAPGIIPFDEITLSGFTEHTHRDIASLKADLTRIASRGYAIDDEEHAPGMRCVAAAVYDERGAPIGAISVSAPTVRMPPERVAEIGRRVAASAAKITALYSGSEAA